MPKKTEDSQTKWWNLWMDGGGNCWLTERQSLNKALTKNPLCLASRGCAIWINAFESELGSRDRGRWDEYQLLIRLSVRQLLILSRNKSRRYATWLFGIFALESGNRSYSCSVYCCLMSCREERSHGLADDARLDGDLVGWGSSSKLHCTALDAC